MVLHLSAFDAVNLLLRDVTLNSVWGLNNKWILQQQWSNTVKRSHLEWSFNWPGVINSCHPGVPAPHDMSFVSTKEASKITRDELDLGDEKCRRKATDSLKLFFLSCCFKVDLTAMGLWWVSALSFHPGYFSTGPIGPTEPRGCRMSSRSSSRVLECRRSNEICRTIDYQTITDITVTRHLDGHIAKMSTCHPQTYQMNDHREHVAPHCWQAVRM